MMAIDLLAATLAFVTGLVVGSLVNLVADRLPRGQSVLALPWQRAACGQNLSLAEVIPVLGYVLLRGRCRSCGAAIGYRRPLVELAGGLITLAAWLLYGPLPATPVAVVFGSVFLLLCVMDIEHRRVYRAVVIPAIVLAVIVSPWWPPARGLVGALIGAAVCFLPYAALYVLIGRVYGRGKGMGLGDVKVAALMGLVAGYPGAVVALYGAIIAGGVTAIALLVTGRRRRRDALPTVPFLAFGALIGVLWSSLGGRLISLLA